MHPDSDETIRFDGRVVIVTGAGKGLGRAVSLLFASRGAQLVVNNRVSITGPGDEPSDSAGELAALIEARGGIAVPERSDMAAPDAARCIAELAMASFGRIDAVIHNAGIIEACGVAELAEADLTRIFEVNTLSAFRLTQQVLPIMRDQNYGRIVFTTSTAALYGNAGLAAYAMAKAALIGLMRSVADEEAPYGIVANAFCPTATTRMTEAFVPDANLRDLLAPERAAPAVAWLASETCNHAGQVIMASGGIFRSAHTLQNAGVNLSSTDAVAPEDVARHIEAITAATQLRGFADSGVHFAALLDELSQGDESRP